VVSVSQMSPVTLVVQCVLQFLRRVQPPDGAKCKRSGSTIERNLLSLSVIVIIVVISTRRMILEVERWDRQNVTAPGVCFFLYRTFYDAQSISVQYYEQATATPTRGLTQSVRTNWEAEMQDQIRRRSPSYLRRTWRSVSDRQASSMLGSPLPPTPSTTATWSHNHHVLGRLYTSVVWQTR